MWLTHARRAYYERRFVTRAVSSTVSAYGARLPRLSPKFIVRGAG